MFKYANILETESILCVQTFDKVNAKFKSEVHC